MAGPSGRSGPPLSLTTRVRAPAAAPRAGERAPILVLFHGVGSNELAMASLAPELDPRLIVVSARSPVQLGPFAYGWYRVDFRPDGPLIDAAEAAAGWDRAAAFVAEAAAALDADPERVFVGGFSQGGIIALATLLTAPEGIAGAICMSGRLPREVLPRVVPKERLRRKPVLLVHGRADEVLTFEQYRRAVGELRERDLRVETVELDIGHTTSPESIAAVASWLSARLDETEASSTSPAG